MKLVFRELLAVIVLALLCVSTLGQSNGVVQISPAPRAAPTPVDLQHPSARLMFVDSLRNDVRKAAPPSSAIIKAVKIKRGTDMLRFHIELVGSADPTTRVPALLECHVFDDRLQHYAVAMVVLEGSISHPKMGRLKRGDAILFETPRRQRRLRVRVQKNGLTLYIPGKEAKRMQWYLITRWRPPLLPIRFSPSSIWMTVVSERSSQPAAMSSTPSLLGFLKNTR